jgi:hypothetical protein
VALKPHNPNPSAVNIVLSSIADLVKVEIINSQTSKEKINCILTLNKWMKWN